MDRHTHKDLALLRGILIAGIALTVARAAAAAEVAPSVPTTSPTTQPSEFDKDQGLVIRFLQDRTRRDPDDITALNRLCSAYLRRFRQSGNDRDLTLAAAAAAQSLKSVPAVQNATALGNRARALFAMHGFAAARDIALQLIELEPGKQYPFDILGDALLELGDYDQAADAYKKMEAFDDPDANTESRLARLNLLRGNLDEARRRFENAVVLARKVEPPAPDAVAWCLVQCGQLAFTTGDWDTAEKQYQLALEAMPSNWSAIDHVAELRAGQRRYAESIALYEPLVARVPRPELLQALGDVYAASGNLKDATVWRHKAIERYLAAAAEGSAHYYHHIAGYYCDSESNPAEALKWAQKDMEVRHSAYAYDGLAWALFQISDFKHAAEAMDKALAVDAKDSHLLYHASLIYYQAGDGVRARDCLARAGQVNSKFNEFHVHR